MTISAGQDPSHHSALRGGHRRALPGDNDDASDRRPMTMTRHGSILVIDDEAAICSSLRRVFSRQHLVQTSTSAREALERFRAGERFDIVLCDLMMPEVSGIELYVEVHRMSPEQAARIVFMSGASVTSQVSEFLSTLPNKFLTKPFDMRLLTELVKQRLSS